MLSNGTIPLNDKERTVLDALAAHPAAPITSITRRDPGEAGPVIVSAKGGVVFEVTGNGFRKLP